MLCFGVPHETKSRTSFLSVSCNNPQISSIWQQRICQSANNDFDILNNHVCELHFDYRCKTGNECGLNEGSLPTLHLPSFGTLFSAGNAHIQINDDRIEEPSHTISIDSLSYHCRFCLRRGLLYEIEVSTYRSKSFLSLIDLPPNVLPDNIQPNACLSCLKSIVIAHHLSMAVEHSNKIFQLLLQHPNQSKVVPNTNFFDIKFELAFCNLILANSLSIKLEIEFEDNVVCADEDYEQKCAFIPGESTSPAAYVNSQNTVKKSLCIAENQENVSEIHDLHQFRKSFVIGAEYTTDLSAEGIPDAIEKFDSCVLIENNNDNAETKDEQFDNEQAAESNSKTVNGPTYKCDLCKFITNYKANFAIQPNLHLAGNGKKYFYCQKCEKDFLLRRHFVRHNTIVHADDFTCKICEKPHASATKLAFHYTKHHHFQCDISTSRLRRGHRAHMLDHKQGQRKSSTLTNKKTHWNENDGVYICPSCDWKNPSFYKFNVHMGKHVQSDKNSVIGSESKELETLETDPERNGDGRYQCTECPKTFRYKSKFRRHKRIHTNERPYKCTECPKAFRDKSHFSRHRKMHTNGRPYKCTECSKTFRCISYLSAHKTLYSNEGPYKCTAFPKTFSCKSNLDTHYRIHTNERPYKCTECPKAFSCRSNLDAHYRIHTNEKPYKCTECPKTFSQKGNCDIHKRIHTNERPYKCTECSKNFSWKSSLNIHKEIHTNEKSYKCTECPKTFSYKTSFSRHKKIHTNERPLVKFKL